MDNDSIEDILKRQGEYLNMEININNDSKSAMVYYQTPEAAFETQRLMNNGKIGDNRILVELVKSIISSSCLWIGYINFYDINVEALVDKLNTFGKIIEMEIFENNMSLYINFDNVKSAVDLKNEISKNSFYNEFGISKAEYCYSIKQDYNFELFEEHHLESSDIKRKYESLEDNSDISNKKVKVENSDQIDNISHKKEENNSDNNKTKKEEVKHESSSKPRRIRTKQERYKGSQFYWSSENDNKIKTNMENKVDTSIKNETSNNNNDDDDDNNNNNNNNNNIKNESNKSVKDESDKDVKEESNNKIDVKNENEDMSVILDEPKPFNRMKNALEHKEKKFKCEISYKNKIGLKMIIHYIDGDMDKPQQVFGDNETIVFKKKRSMEKDTEFIDNMTKRLGFNGDPSWSFCIGYIDDEGDYTKKMKNDFDNIDILNDEFNKNSQFLIAKLGNSDTCVTLFPNSYKCKNIMEQVFVEETYKEKVIMSGLDKWPFFMFVIFDPKSKFSQ
ncbi:hypothetical protein BCR32DRAFT_329552 [Anaeromyces robustus]|uniref:RRM domain-containing protein n=1 Tax=Anaeromyces robustus TaxID=1754192 RepID=A0A1Y1WSA5_9FUNG|nr:hypothetical protein BCR32DRAFT_329552 [Anaeromyces robustus]|eukprot:ORX76014.1 hypothetical protein BCR32DRAFT_329552 [Anaeromyces robustus]